MALLLGVWLLMVWNLEDLNEKRMQEEVELVARAIREPLSRALDGGNQSVVRQSLRSAFRIGRVYGAFVYDSDGRILAAAGAIEPPPRRRTRVQEIAADGARRGEYGSIGGRRIFSYFIPLTDSGGRISAVLQVTRRRSDIEVGAARLRMQASGLLLALTGGAVGLVLWGHRRAVGAPLTRLTKDMAHVKQGDRRHRSTVSGPLEITALRDSLNSMLDSIEQSAREIDVRRRAQRDLEGRLRQSEKLAALGRLAAGVAHEMGTPLGVIDGLAQRSLRVVEAPEPLRDALLQTREQVRRLERTVRQLLDFGRVRRPQLQRIAVGDVAAQTVELLAFEGGAAIDMDGPPEIELDADPGILEQALLNLLRNALHAAGEECQVRLRWRREDDSVVITVEDDGPGIPPALREFVFDPFFTTKAVGEGVGLGLAIAHSAVQDLHGSIEAGESSQLGGACFHIRLPLRNELHQDAQGEA